MKNFLAVLGICALLTGCSFPLTQQSSSDVRYYVLSAPTPASADLQHTQRIGILPITLPGYLARPQLVVRDKDKVNIVVHDFDRWGESLSLGITRVLCDSLAREGLSAIPLRTGVKVQNKLLLDIRRLDGPLGGNVVLDAVWTLQNDQGILHSGRVLLHQPSGNNLESMVEAQSLLLHDLAKHIAHSIS
jgi:hypothetical protein